MWELYNQTVGVKPHPQSDGEADICGAMQANFSDKKMKLNNTH